MQSFNFLCIALYHTGSKISSHFIANLAHTKKNDLAGGNCMLFRLLSFFYTPSRMPLRVPAGFDRRLRKLLSHLPTDGDAFPAAHTLAGQASFLYEKYLSLKRDLKASPRLPARDKTPYLLLVARDICGRLPLDKGHILFSVRKAYKEQDITTDELNLLPAALYTALIEQLLPCLEKALLPLDEEAALSLRHTCARCLEAMHTLSRVRFDTLFEHLSPVARVLQEEETYRQMDRESRRYYVNRAAFLAKKWNLSEPSVARAALSLAEEKEGHEGEAGYYLIEQPRLIAAYLHKKVHPFSEREKTLWYISVFALAGLSVTLFWLLVRAPLWLLPFGLSAFSEGVRQLVYRFARKHFPARMLPRLQKKHIAAQRLLVVIPTLLTGEKQALRMAAHMNALHAATPHADFMLLADFADSREPMTQEDAAVIRTARAAIDALNQNAAPAFYYFHRARTWDESQECYTGRERKRGALESLNLILCGKACPDTFLHTTVPLEQMHHRYDQVITLDADTVLPPGAAARLQGAMLHPLQKGRIAVIQPRMETLSSAIRTRIQHFLSAPGGLDAYQRLIPNVYQDVFGRGSFAGKGIYDPRLFLERTEGRLPAGRILSHDLIEGELAGSAQAEDIVFFDSQPSRLSGWQKRLHRWTRGDWQLLPFLWDRHLSLLSRWKMYDNLRLSLLPLCQMALLLGGAFLQHPFLMLLGLPYPIRGMGKRLLLLPGKAVTQLDAVIRALFRQFISRKGLLSWVTADQAESASGLPLSCILTPLLCGTALTVLSLLPWGVLPGLIPGVMWLASPLLREFMDKEKPLHPPLTAPEEEAVRTLCRDTWHFFERNVHAGTFYLPPDNVQLQPEKGPALRTSPTNIGLYLLSTLAARELSLITTAQMARRMLRTVETLEKMEKWQGHLYNWYSLEDLSILPPRFISTVDSGNLCACLFACAQGVRQHLAEMDASAHPLPARLDALARAMQFTPLYDPAVSLFHIGFDTESGRLSPNHYDLLASECRLASYVSVMQRQVPLKHWYALGRNVTRQGGGAALISWGGTAFEYLMPHLLLPLYENTLLSEGCKSALRAQMAAAKGRPFGISESGHYAFDPQMNYQYRAFGLPALALSDHTGGQVVAPYASMLALPLFPKAAIRNLQWMRKLSWYSQEGLFEAADYTPDRLAPAPRLVQSHMAHHQGMILCAACNLLTGNVLCRHFMAPAAPRAYGFLLCDGKPPLPPPSHPLPRPRKKPADHTYAYPAAGNFPVPAHALSGHGVTWVMNRQGYGFLKSGDLLWTRFFPDAPSGPMFYLRNCKTGEYTLPQCRGQMVFENGCIRIPVNTFSLEGEMRLYVLPLNGEAVADFCLENKGGEEAQIELISYLEITQSTFLQDAAHPNFRDLSIRIDPCSEAGLISRRLSADENSRLPVLIHTVCGQVDRLHRQGDRLLFLGREGDLHRPAALSTDAPDVPCRIGAVIAPCMSLRAGVRIPAGKTIQVQFSLLEAPWHIHTAAPALHSREELQLCRTRESMVMNLLSLSADNIPLYSQMLGALCFSAQPFQCHVPSSMDTLWKYGLSGNEPVCCVYLKTRDKALIRHAVYAHAWMETQGLFSSLLFLCSKDAQDYHTPLQDAAHAAISLLPAGRERIHIVTGDDEDARKLKSLSHLYLESGTPLSAQLSALSIPLPAPAPLSIRPAAPLPPPPLQMETPCGGFTKEGDFCIHSAPPAPWHNILMGRRFGTILCESAILHSFCDNAQMNRITKRPRDVHRPEGAEEILLQGERGFLSLTCGLVTHRPGVTEYAADAEGIRSTVTVFSHMSLPVGLRIITLQAPEDTDTLLRCIVRFSAGQMPCGCEQEEDTAFALSPEKHGIGFAHLPEGAAHLLPSPLCHTADPALFHTPGGDAAVFTLPLSLKGRRTFTIPLLVGWAESKEDAVAHIQAVLLDGPARALQQVRTFWQEQLEGLLLFGGDPMLSPYLNRFLPYQALCARLMARTGPYQTGGAFGFRDQLQDLLCCLHTHPSYARSHILLCAAHQYREGDVQHWWHAPRTGVRTRISDDKLFLPFLACLYAEVTGDSRIFLEEAPFLVSEPLKDTEEDRYETPEISQETAPLLQHCLLAIESVRFGPQGIPLMAGGDWNDGMNRVGGESVWLGFFLCMVLQKMVPHCNKETAERYKALRAALLKNLEKAWAGEWYLRAWYLSGEPMAGPRTHPPRIDLISQAFACLAGAPREHVRMALAHAVETLYKKETGQVLLMHPPFAPSENAGYIGAYVPGVRENGGQYTHAVPWLIMALCETGQYDTAWDMARDLLPITHTDTPKKLAVYRLEPYVLCGDVYAGENPGRGGWSWYTGSAAWLYYVYITVLLGLEKRGNRLRLAPCPHPDMEEFTLVYRFGSTAYHLTAGHDILFATLDGEKMQDGWVTLQDDGKTHEARFPWKKR